MSAPVKPADANVCPLCQQANQCAMEIAKTTGAPQKACWCTQAKIGAAVLERIPTASRSLACVCARCVQQFQALPNPVSTQPKENHANVPH